MSQIKIGYFTITASIFCLLLLVAQSVGQAQTSRQYPKNLIFRSYTSWRWIMGQDSVKYKGVTVEEGNADLETDRNMVDKTINEESLHYLDTKPEFWEDLNMERASLLLKDLYRDPLTKAVSIIKGQYEEEKDFRFVLIDEPFSEINDNRSLKEVIQPNIIAPQNLVGTHNYTSDITNQTKFNWKHIIVDSTQQRVLVLEDWNYQYIFGS